MQSRAEPYPQSSPSNVVPINEKRAAYVVMTNVDVTRTILGTLGASAYAVYAFIDTYCNESAEAWVSITTIMEGTRLSKSTVQRAIKTLIAGGWLQQRERTNQFGFVIGFTYTLPHHMTPPDKRGVTGGVTPESEPVHERVKCAPEVNTKVTPKVNALYDAHRPQLSEDAQRRLSEFRRAYPSNRVRHSPAELAQLWAGLSDDEQAAAIAGVRAWAADEEWTRENGRYVPGIIKFVTERGWESAPLPTRTTGNASVDFLQSVGVY